MSTTPEKFATCPGCGTIGACLRDGLCRIALTPPPAAEPRTTERHIALREGHQIASEDAYFEARPGEVDSRNSHYFREGFKRGFDAAEKAYPAALSPQAEQRKPQVGDRKPGVLDPSSAWPVYSQEDIDKLYVAPQASREPSETPAEDRILNAVTAYVDACEENGEDPGPETDAKTEEVWASLVAIVRAALATREEAQPSERTLRDAVSDVFRIGSAARSDQTILVNASNAMHRSGLLSAIERTFFTKTEKDEDGWGTEECSLNSWGSTREEYVEQFRAALATREEAQPSELQAENERLRTALRFYANRDHFTLSDDAAWDTVSDEPPNFWCDEAGTATVEDGSIAAMVLRGVAIDWTADDGEAPAPIEGEAPAAPQAEQTRGVVGSHQALLRRALSYLHMASKGAPFSSSGRSNAATLLVDIESALAAPQASREPSTPAAQWRVDGEPDPHTGHYDGERATLALGNLTDDELANGAFMNYNVVPSFEDMVNPRPGQHMPIVWMTAVKDRIRWLSRALERSLATREEAQPSEALTEQYAAVGRAMVEMTTTVQGPEEWGCIPELWRMCMEERDAARAALGGREEAPEASEGAGSK